MKSLITTDDGKITVCDPEAGSSSIPSRIEAERELERRKRPSIEPYSPFKTSAELWWRAGVRA